MTRQRQVAGAGWITRSNAADPHMLVAFFTMLLELLEARAGQQVLNSRLQQGA